MFSKYSETYQHFRMRWKLEKGKGDKREKEIVACKAKSERETKGRKSNKKKKRKKMKEEKRRKKRK